MDRRTILTVGWGVCGALVFAAAYAADPPSGQHPAPYPTRMNQKFTDPQANIAEFVKRFEDANREVYAKRREITRAVRLKPGDAVADIGAGTGLFTFLFADQVGPKGTVFAVDISPAFTKHIGDQGRRRGYERVVKPVLNTPDSAELASGSVDVVFVCDTYHHFEHSAKMLASIHRALRPGGRLVLVDFDLHKDSNDYVKQRARAPKETYFKEIAAAGFELIETPRPPTIKDHFFAEFKRVDRQPPGRVAPPSPQE